MLIIDVCSFFSIKTPRGIAELVPVGILIVKSLKDVLLLLHVSYSATQIYKINVLCIYLLNATRIYILLHFNVSPLFSKDSVRFVGIKLFGRHRLNLFNDCFVIEIPENKVTNVLLVLMICFCNHSFKVVMSGRDQFSYDVG